MNAIIIENDPEIADTLKDIVGKTGVDVSLCEDGNTALAFLEKNNAALVIVEQTLQDIDGLQLCLKIREILDSTKMQLLLIMPHTAPEEIQAIIQSGIDDVILRPLDMQQCTASIEGALSNLRKTYRLIADMARLASQNELLTERNIRLREEISYLNETNRQVSELFFGLPTACFTYDADGRIHEWNRACESLYGMNETEAQNRHIWETIKIMADENRIRQLINQVFAGNRFEGLEWEGRALDGSSKHILYNTYPLRDPDGSVFGGISACMDITSLREAENRMRLLSMAVEKSLNGIVITDSKQRILYANPAYEAITGYRLDEVLGRKPERFLQGPLTDTQSTRTLRDAIRNVKPAMVEMINYHKSGKPFWVEIRVTPVFNNQGQCTHWVALENDITQRKKTEESIIESEQRFRSAIDSMQEGLLVIDRDGYIRHCNASAEAILGVDGTLNGAHCQDICLQMLSEEGTPLTWDNHPMRCSLEKEETLRQLPLRIEAANKPAVWISLNSSPLKHAQENEPYAMLVTFSDITEHKRSEKQIADHLERIKQACQQLEQQKLELKDANEKLESLADTDGLTGVYNHRMLQKRLQEEYERAIRYNLPLSVVMIDVDRFKRYNDTYGHPAGDEVLRQIAQMLQNNVRTSDVVTRYGGEEFVIILPNTDRVGAMSLSERFRFTLEMATWAKCQVTASFGVTTLSPSTPDRLALVEEADKAMYQAKENGRNRVEHYYDVIQMIQKKAA
jgi:diguanylate cyclase (GGDEF)-like protein/PAS domain S-box-containing protein